MIVNPYVSKQKVENRAGSAPFPISLKWKFLELTKNRYTQEQLNLKIKKIQVEQQRFICNKENKEWMKKHYLKGELPLFSSIEIETINRCNGSCPFCPVNHNDDKRKFKKMDAALFHKIIDELRTLDYSGRLALHSNNEPFLDKRIIEFAKYARERLPKAFIYLYTNGTLVSLDKFLEIMKYLDVMHFDNYDDDLKLSENAKIIQEYCKTNKNMDKRVIIHLRKINEVLSTRGGQSPNNQKRETLDLSCILPFKQMVIRPDGKCSLCCNDPLGKNTMGDVNKNTLKEVWYGERYIKMRRSLIAGRKYVSLCKYCDTLAGVSGY